MLLEADPIIFDRLKYKMPLKPGDEKLVIVYLHDDSELTHKIVTRWMGSIQRAEIYSEITTWVRDPETHFYDKTQKVLLYSTDYVFGFTSHGPGWDDGQYGKCKAIRIDYDPEDDAARIIFKILSVRFYE